MYLLMRLLVLLICELLAVRTHSLSCNTVNARALLLLVLTLVLGHEEHVLGLQELAGPTCRHRWQTTVAVGQAVGLRAVARARLLLLSMIQLLALWTFKDVAVHQGRLLLRFHCLRLTGRLGLLNVDCAAG